MHVEEVTASITIELPEGGEVRLSLDVMDPQGFADAIANDVVGAIERVLEPVEPGCDLCAEEEEVALADYADEVPF
jgi:hypothetical protein